MIQAQIEELNAARIQEEVEREWRRKEKAEAIHRAETLKALRKARDAQINNKIQLQALEIQREKNEFEKILALQKESLCREEKEREKKHKRALKHRSEILKQVNKFNYSLYYTNYMIIKNINTFFLGERKRKRKNNITTENVPRRSSDPCRSRAT